MTKRGGNSALLALQSEVNKELEKTGAKSRMYFGSDPRFAVKRIDSGSLWLNRILGGGFAKGRHVELSGTESSAKSYITYKCMALAQARGEIVALLDPEGAFKPDWYDHLGGNVDDLLIERPKSAEEAIKTLTILLRGREIDAPVGVIGVDSISALVTMEELTKDPTEGQSRIASQARMMSEGLRRLTPFMEDTLVLWVNQFRTGGIGSFMTHNTTSGGRAMRFYATSRLEFQKDKTEKRKLTVAKHGRLVDVQIPYGHWVQLKNKKEKSTFPYREGSFFFDNERGEVDWRMEILDLGLNDDIIERKGDKYFYTDDLGDSFEGRKSVFLRFLEEDQTLADELIEKIEAETQRLAQFHDVDAEDDEDEDE